MNTIPTTFSQAAAELPSYTAVGGKNRLGSAGLSAVLLYREKRASQFALFEELGKQGFDYVISVEGSGRPRDLEGLAESFPFVRFILLKEFLSPGEAINLAALELGSPLFFVLWDDQRIVHSGGAQRMADRLAANRASAEENKTPSPFARLCTVPLIQNKRYENIPTLTSPAMAKGNFTPVHSVPSRESQHSLYPFDGSGIYDRGRFTRLGGFDGSIKNFHWQLLDFGFRSFFWGEEIASTLAVKLAYEKDAPEEDSSSDENYRRFYLKNLAPVFRGDYTNLPLRRFPKYLKLSRMGVFSAWKEFEEGRRWVDENSRSFRIDSKLLIETWKHPEGDMT